MAISLETLVLEFQGDFKNLDKGLDAAVRRSTQKIKPIEKLSLCPKVDLKELHELNRLLDEKQRHWKETVDFFARNPIKPKGGAGGAAANAKYSVVSKTEVTHKYNLKLSPVTSGIRKSNSLLSKIVGNTKKEGVFSSVLKGFIGNTLGKAIQGGFFEFGAKFSQQVTKEIKLSSQGEAATATVRKAARRTATIGTAAASGLSEIAFGNSKKRGKEISTMVDQSLDVLENLFDPDKFVKTSRQLRLKLFEVITKMQTGQMDGLGAAKEIATSAQKAAPDQVNNLLFRTLQLGSLPLLIKKEFINAMSAREIEKFGKNFERLNRVLAKDLEISDLNEKENLVISVGGFERKKGTSSQQTAEMLRPFFDEKTTAFTQIINPFTDRYGGQSQSKVYDIVQQILEPMGIALGGEAKSMISNLEILMESSLKGKNTDAVRMATATYAVKQLFPDKNIGLAGFSGGGFVVEQAISILEALKDLDTKGLGIGTPFFGLTQTADPTRFRSVVGATDPQSAFYDKQYAGFTEELMALIEQEIVKAGGSPEDLRKAPFRVSDLVDIITDRVDINHDVWSYFKSNQSYEIMRKMLPGMRDANAPMDTEGIPADFLEKYSKFFELLDGKDPFLAVPEIRAMIVKLAKGQRFLNPKYNQGDIGYLEELADKPASERSGKEQRRLDWFLGAATEQLVTTYSEKDLKKKLTSFSKVLGKQALSKVITDAGVTNLRAQTKELYEASVEPQKEAEAQYKVLEKRDKAEAKQMKTLLAEKQELAASGKTNSKKYKDLDKSIAELQATIDEHKAETKKVSDKSKFLTSVVNQGAFSLEDFFQAIEDYNTALDEMVADMASKPKRTAKTKAGAKLNQMSEVFTSLTGVETGNLQKEAKQFLLKLFDFSGFNQQLKPQQERAKKLLWKLTQEQMAKAGDGVEIDKGTDFQKVLAYSLATKRKEDDIKLLQGLQIAHKGKSDIGEDYEFFNLNDPVGKITREIDGFIKAITEPAAENLKGSSAGKLAQDYDKFWKTLQQALARFVVEGTAIPDDFMAAAEKILTAKDKLADIEFPDIKGMRSFDSYKKDLLKAAKEGNKQARTELSSYERKQLSEFNKRVSDYNLANPDKARLTPVNIQDTIPLGEGMNGVTVLEQTTGRVIKFAAESSQVIGTSIDQLGKKFKDLAPVLAAIKPLIPQKNPTGAFPVEAKNIVEATKAGLTNADLGTEQIQGFLQMSLQEGKPISSYAKDIDPEDFDRDKLEIFLNTLVRSGQVLKQFHEKGFVHRDLHINNVFEDLEGELRAIDFGSLEELPKILTEADVLAELKKQGRSPRTQKDFNIRTEADFKGSNLTKKQIKSQITADRRAAYLGIQADQAAVERAVKDSGKAYSAAIAEDVTRAIQHTIGVLEGMGLELNPSMIAEAYRIGVNDADKAKTPALAANELVKKFGTGGVVGDGQRYFRPKLTQPETEEPRPEDYKFFGNDLEFGEPEEVISEVAQSNSILENIFGVNSEILKTIRKGGDGGAGKKPPAKDPDSPEGEKIVSIGQGLGDVAATNLEVVRANTLLGEQIKIVSETVASVGAGTSQFKVSIDNLTKTTVDLKQTNDSIQGELQKLNDFISQAMGGRGRGGNQPKGQQALAPGMPLLPGSRPDEGLGKRAMRTIAQTPLEATRGVYGFLKGVEEVAFTALPAAKSVKRLTQAVAPLALLGGAAVASPEIAGLLGGALDVSTAIATPIAELGGSIVATGAETVIVHAFEIGASGAADMIAGSLPYVGEGVSQALLSASPEIGASIATAVGETIVAGSGVVGGAIGLGLPAYAASAGINNLVGKGFNAVFDPAENLKQLSAAEKGKQLAKDFAYAGVAAKQLGQSLDKTKRQITPLKDLKALPPGQLKHIGEIDLRTLEKQAIEANTALAATNPKDRMASSVAQNKAQIMRMINERLKLLKKQGVDIDINIPSIKEIEAMQAGKNFAQGVAQGIKQDSQQVIDVTNALGKNTLSEIEDVWDIQSPSGEGRKRGKYLGQGIIEGVLSTAGNLKKSVQDLAKKALKGLDETFSSGLSEEQSAKITKFGADIRESFDGLLSFLANVRPPKNVQEVVEAFSKGFLGDNAAKQTLSVMQVAALATGAALITFGGQMRQAVTETIAFLTEIEQVELQLKAVQQFPLSGNIFAEFSDAANRANADVVAFASQFAQISASLQGKVIDPRGLFEDLATGLSLRGVVGETQDRALNALQQMASKGVVSMEELRQQLSEALPGAIRISSEAVGLAEREFIALVSSGQLLASQFLPKLAKELQVSGEVTETLTGEITQLRNTWNQVRFEASKVLPLKKAIQGLRKALEGVGKISQPLSVAIGTIAVLLGGNLAVQAAIAVVKIKAVAAALKFTALSIGTVGGLLAVVAAGLASYNLITIKAADPVRKLNQELKDLANGGLKQVQQGFEGYTQSTFLGKFLDRMSGKPLHAEREELEIRNYHRENASIIQQETAKIRQRIRPEDIEKTKREMAEMVEMANDLAYKIANRQAFGINQDEALDMQKELDELNAAMQLRLQIKYDPASMEELLKKTEDNIRSVKAEIEKGADKEINLQILARLEADRKQIKAALREVKQILIESKPIIEAEIRATVAQESIDNQLEITGTAKELELYQQLAEEKASSRVAEIRSRKQQMTMLQTELDLIRQSNKEQQKHIAMLSAAQKERLQKALGSESLENISLEQVSTARQRLEAEERGGIDTDPNLIEALESLERLAENTKRSNRALVEQAKYQYEQINILRELNRELEELEIERLRTAVGTRERLLQLDRTYGEDSQALFDANREQGSLRQDLERQIIDLTLSYAQAVEGIEDFTFSLISSAKQMALRLEQIGRDMAKSAINAISDQLGAAGIEDILGLNRLRQVATRSLDVAASDQRPSLQLELQESRRNYERQRLQNERQRNRMALDARASVQNLVNQRQEIERRRKLFLEDEALTPDRIKVELTDLSFQASNLNRSINSANSAAAEEGLNRVLPGFNPTLPELSSLQGDARATKQALDNIYGDMINQLNNAISLTKDAASTGQAEINQAMVENYQAFQQNASMQRRLIKKEGQRVEQEYTNILAQLKGFLFAIKQNLSNQVIALRGQAITSTRATQDIFAEFGVSTRQNQSLDLIQREATQKIDSQIQQNNSLREQLMEYLKIENPEELLKQIEGANELPSRIKQPLVEELRNISDTADFKKVLVQIKESSMELLNNSQDLENAKNQLVANARRQALEQWYGQIDDLNLQLRQASLDSANWLPENDRIKLQIEIDEQQASLEVDRKVRELIQSKAPTEVVRAVETRLRRLNAIRFDKLRREASTTFQIVQDLKESLETNIASALANIGDAFFGQDSQERELEELRVRAELGEKLIQAQEKYADNPDQLNKVTERLEMLNRAKLDGIKNEAEGLSSIFKVLGQTVADVLQSIAENFAKMAAQKIAFSLFGNFFNPGVKAAGGGILGFKQGGEVPFAGSGMGSGSLMQAIQKEGAGARVVVAHAGEEILTTKNNDAQFQRALRKSGQWDELKKANGFSNYKYGGSVGGRNNMVSLGKNKYDKPKTTSKVNIKTTYNLKVENPNTLNRSQVQVIKANEMRNRREYRRNR